MKGVAVCNAWTATAAKGLKILTFLKLKQKKSHGCLSCRGFIYLSKMTFLGIIQTFFYLVQL